MTVAASNAKPVGADRPLIAGLTGIRGIAAGAVVLDHFRSDLITVVPQLAPLSPWFKGGFLGVEVFFILSGFIIAYNYASRFQQFSVTQYRRFIELRVARIYPVHLVTLLAIAGLASAAAVGHIQLNVAQNYTLTNFVGNVVMLQGMPGFVGFNGPAWSITWEFVAYLAFPLLAFWLAQLRTSRAGAVSAALVLLVGTAAMLWILPLVGDSAVAWIMMMLRIATGFTSGALLFACWRSLPAGVRTSRWWDLVLVGSAIAVLAVILPTGGGAYALASVPFIALFVLACASSSGPIGKFLGLKGMEWGGRVSYSLYMTHFTVILVLHKLLPAGKVAAHGPLAAAGYVALVLAAVIGVAALCYYSVEEPGRRFIRRLVGRGEKRPVTVPPEYLPGGTSEQV